MTAQPINFFTRTEYKGQNAVDLRLQGYKSDEWATYKQWLNGGYQVQKGQKGTGIMVVTEDEKNNKKAVRWYRVFNIEQVKEITDEEKKQLKEAA